MKMIKPSANPGWLYLTVFLCNMIVSSSYSQSIGTWNFNNNVNGVPGSNNTVSVANFSAGVSSTAYNGGIEYFGQDGWPSGAVDPAVYLQFTLTPSSGYSIDISAVNIRVRHSSTGSNGGSGPKRFSLRSSLDGYSTDIYTGNLTSNYSYHSVNPGGTYTNLPTAVTFRIYGFDAVVNPGGISRFVFDNIEVQGIGVVLPVKIRAFNAIAINDQVRITYRADNSSAGTRYLIERSTNGTSFAHLRETTQETSSAEFSQDVTDESIPVNADKLHYRLTIRSNDGSVTVSRVNTVRIPATTATLRAFAKNNSVYLTGTFEKETEIILVNTAGQLIAQQKIEGITGNRAIILDYPAIFSGILHVIATDKTGRRTVSVTAL